MKHNLCFGAFFLMLRKEEKEASGYPGSPGKSVGFLSMKIGPNLVA